MTTIKVKYVEVVPCPFCASIAHEHNSKSVMMRHRESCYLHDEVSIFIRLDRIEAWNTRKSRKSEDYHAGMLNAARICKLEAERKFDHARGPHLTDAKAIEDAAARIAADTAASDAGMP